MHDILEIIKFTVISFFYYIFNFQIFIKLKNLKEQKRKIYLTF